MHIATIPGCADLDGALRICADAYPRNRRQDMLSATNPTGWRMTASPVGFPVAICMSPDLTFGLLGAQFHPDRAYLDTLLGHCDFLPRNQRLNGRFFINEDLLAGAGRVMSQVMYPLWVWRLFTSLGDVEILRRHQEPVRRALAWVADRADAAGVVRQVDPGDWQVSEGADWVDWSPERMEGSTCVFHCWYAYALACAARLERRLGDAAAATAVETLHRRQAAVVRERFWSGRSFYDNLAYVGGKVENFWLDSQLWPIAFGYADAAQAAMVFARIDADPATFEATPTRWCAPLPAGMQVDHPSPVCPPEPAHRPFSWFGRLGAGDAIARARSGQGAHAERLLRRYASLVVRHGTCPECLGMDGEPSFGTGGQGDYLEHAGGFLWAVATTMFGVDSDDADLLRCRPALPVDGGAARLPLWRHGRLVILHAEGGRMRAEDAITGMVVELPPGCPVELPGGLRVVREP